MWLKNKTKVVKEIMQLLIINNLTGIIVHVIYLKLELLIF